ERSGSGYASRCSVRRGTALLAGLVVCGRCGRRLRTQYGGRASKPRYNCSANHSCYGEPLCQSVAARALDDEVVRLTLKALQPSALDVSRPGASDLQNQAGEEQAVLTQPDPRG